MGFLAFGGLGLRFGVEGLKLRVVPAAAGLALPLTTKKEEIPYKDLSSGFLSEN